MLFRYVLEFSVDRNKRICHHIVEGTSEFNPRIHDLQSTTTLVIFVMCQMIISLLRLFDIYNCIIFPSLNHANIFDSIPDKHSHKVVRKLPKSHAQ